MKKGDSMSDNVNLCSILTLEMKVMVSRAYRRYTKCAMVLFDMGDDNIAPFGLP